MLLRNLDLDILRTLVTTHDVGGFAQAADRLGLTPSAISLQMKRLQEELGAPLFRKHGRALKLTEAGQTALGYARRMLALNDDFLETMHGVTLAGTVRIGAPQDFASVLPDALRQFAALYPRTQVELRIEGNGALIEALDKGQLDLTLTIGFRDRKDALLLGELPVLWISSRTFRMQDAALPLAVLGPQCAFRKARCNNSKPPESRTVSRLLVQAWTAYGRRFKGALVSPHAPRCNYQRLWWRINRCIAFPVSPFSLWFCIVARTPRQMRSTLFMLCLPWQHKMLLPDSHIRNVRASREKHKRRSFHR